LTANSGQLWLTKCQTENTFIRLPCQKNFLVALFKILALSAYDLSTQRSKPQPNSGKPCRMLVSPPGRTASEFIDRRLAMPIDEF
ncbi:MAG: hypothetical protein BECKG1743E_GA0114224_110311, partial [Candidatus Kentron sp. G]